ncbi:MAG: PIN domain protein [Bacteroidetes bacterium]|nr:PIN domain protein [Bacteroidota bacterium]
MSQPVQRIYIDTSVIGGCFDDEFKEWSVKLFEEFKTGNKIAVISDIAIDELRLARAEVRLHIETTPKKNIEFIAKDKEVDELADKYIKEGAITKKFHEDALHIAMATINKVDVLASWNFKHIVNLERIRKYNAVNLKNGYSILEIRNPRDIIHI